MIYDENDTPEFTDEVIARSRPARDVLSPQVMAAFKNKGGRPKTESPKVPVSLRLDQDVVDGWKATGSGWQTRMNDALRRALP